MMRKLCAYLALNGALLASAYAQKTPDLKPLDKASKELNNTIRETKRITEDASKKIPVPRTEIKSVEVNKNQFNEAKSYLKNQDFENAYNQFYNIVKNKGEYKYKAALYMAVILDKKGDYKKSLNLLQKIINSKNAPLEVKSRAKALFEVVIAKAKNSDAENRTIASAKQNRTPAQIEMENTGIVAFNNKNYKKSHKIFRKLASETDSDTAHFMLGSIYYIHDKNKRALASFSKLQDPEMIAEAKEMLDLSEDQKLVSPYQLERFQDYASEEYETNEDLDKAFISNFGIKYGYDTNPNRISGSNRNAYESLFLTNNEIKAQGFYNINAGFTWAAIKKNKFSLTPLANIEFEDYSNKYEDHTLSMFLSPAMVYKFSKTLNLTFSPSFVHQRLNNEKLIDTFGASSSLRIGEKTSQWSISANFQKYSPAEEYKEFLTGNAYGASLNWNKKINTLFVEFYTEYNKANFNEDSINNDSYKIGSDIDINLSKKFMLIPNISYTYKLFAEKAKKETIANLGSKLKYKLYKNLKFELTLKYQFGKKKEDGESNNFKRLLSSFGVQLEF